MVLRYVEALADRAFLTKQGKNLSPPRLEVPDPLWDGDLDG